MNHGRAALDATSWGATPGDARNNREPLVKATSPVGATATGHESLTNVVNWVVVPSGARSHVCMSVGDSGLMNAVQRPATAKYEGSPLLADERVTKPPLVSRTRSLGKLGTSPASWRCAAIFVPSVTGDENEYKGSDVSAVVT